VPLVFIYVVGGVGQDLLVVEVAEDVLLGRGPRIGDVEEILNGSSTRAAGRRPAG
jgi:hypothetical protein